MNAEGPRFGRLPQIRLVRRSDVASAVEHLERLLDDDNRDGQPSLPYTVVSTSAEALSRPSGEFSVEIHDESGAVVLLARGHLDLASATRLGAVLADLLDRRRNVQLEVDLRQSSGIDPAGLGVFDAVARIATRRGSRLSVRQPSDQSGAVPGHCGHHHLVEFYESDELLGESVGRFIDPALRGDGGVIVVATGRHRHLFESALEGAGIDVAGARAADRYIDRDAGETLDQFMIEGAPDPGRFAAIAAGLIARAGRGGRPVRIYGEMVAVLWAEGNVAAAIALEDLWNDIARQQPFSLLCAYPLTAFDQHDATASFRTICEQHAPPSHPVPA